jgi:predicted RNase H-like nuclease (RuvC/YqgF family)
LKKADFKKSSLTSGTQAADLKLIMLQSMGMQINVSLQHKESDTQCADSTQHFSKTNEGLLRKLQGHVAESCQMNPCYDFIMQLSKRIYILENKSNEVDMIEDNLEEKPDIQQQLSKINKITSEFDQFKLDVNLLSAKISSFEDRLTSLESNEDFLFQQAEIILHNASVIEEYVKINTNKQEALDTSFNNVTGEIELLKLSATLQRSMVKQISSFKIFYE